MNLLLAMSLSGNMVFLLYLVIKPFSYRYLTAKWQYTMLKVSMLFYLLPYQYLKYDYYNILDIFNYPVINTQFESGIVVIDINNAVFRTGDGSTYFKNQGVIFGSLLIWLLIVFSVIIYQVIKYFKCKQTLLMISDSFSPKSNVNIVFEQCLNELNINNKKKRIRIFTNPNITSPFTLGELSPIIMIPKSCSNISTLSAYLKHELTHINNHDMLFKFLSFFIILLHWYNPLVYLIFIELCNISEKCCDEIVILHMNDHEKKEYGLLIIQAAEPHPEISILFADSFSRTNFIIKGRIKHMIRNSTKNNKHVKIATILTSLLIFILTPISVLAYQPPVEITRDILNESDLIDDFSIIIDEQYLAEFDILPLLDYSDHQEYFIDYDGIVFELLPSDQISPRLCIHSYVSGYRQSHSSTGAGCTILTYNCKICLKCQNTVYGTIFSQSTYPNCPH